MKAAKKLEPAPRAKAALPDLTARWATAKVMEETGKREAESLRAEIETFPEARNGYEDDHLKIGTAEQLEGFSMIQVLENEKLGRKLEKLGVIEQVLEHKVSVAKVRALAKLNPDVAKALEEISSPATRFYQVRKKGG